MLRQKKFVSLITPLVFIAFLSFPSHPKVTGQEVQPGATPAWIKGDPNAPVSLEIFNDYQCPPCAKMNEELKKIDAEYQGRVLLIFRN